MSNQSWDAIVIGSGMGGMACASALAHYGKKVLVLEQHYVAGGMTHTFKRKGFVWDVGVHALGEMSEKRLPGRLLNWLSDDGIKMNRYANIYDTFYLPDGFKFELPADKEEYRTKLKEAFPEEVEAIDKYIDMVNQVGKSAKGHFMARNLPKFAEGLIGPMIKKEFNRWAYRTTKEVLDELTSNERLKTVLCGQWGYYGSPPSKSSFFIHAVTVRHFWDGGYYPEGTSKTMAEKLLAPVTKVGGEVRTQVSVKEILTEGSKAIGVVTDKGETIYADTVISAAGAKATVERLLPAKIKSASWAQNISKLKQSPCHVCLYLGFEGDIRSAGATESNQWFFETWDMEHTHWDINDPNAEAPALFTSFPSLKDPAHSPDDIKQTGEVVTFIPWEVFEKWKDTEVRKRGEDYEAFKKDIEARMLNQLWKHRPDLKDKCVFHELSTPLSTTFYCRAPQGAIYGLEPTPERFRCKDLRPQTPVKNLYLTGGDIGTLGVIGAMIGGILTAGKIDRRVLNRLMN